MLSIIVATDLKGAIGYKTGGLPWKLPSEHTHYREIVAGKFLLMSNKNFEISHKNNTEDKIIILSRSKKKQDFSQYKNVVDVFETMNEFMTSSYSEENVFCLGGSAIYEQALPFTSRLHLSVISTETDADVFFPEWEQLSWKKEKEIEHSNENEPHSWKYYLYSRIP